MLSGVRAAEGRNALLSSAIEDIVARCLETDRARRWQSTAELAGALDIARTSDT
jgi:hypothetical protein